MTLCMMKGREPRLGIRPCSKHFFTPRKPNNGKQKHFKSIWSQKSLWKISTPPETGLTTKNWVLCNKMEVVTTGLMDAIFMVIRAKLNFKTCLECSHRKKTTSKGSCRFKAWQEALDLDWELSFLLCWMIFSRRLQNSLSVWCLIYQERWFCSPITHH